LPCRVEGNFAELFSLSYQRMQLIRNQILGKDVFAPATGMQVAKLKLADIEEVRVSNDSIKRLQLQVAQVRDIGKRVVKPENWTDDLFRTFALGITVCGQYRRELSDYKVGRPPFLLTPPPATRHVSMSRSLGSGAPQMPMPGRSMGGARGPGDGGSSFVVKGGRSGAGGMGGGSQAPRALMNAMANSGQAPRGGLLRRPLSGGTGNPAYRNGKSHIVKVNKF
jgi:hypothetical protein